MSSQTGTLRLENYISALLTPSLLIYMGGGGGTRFRIRSRDELYWQVSWCSWGTYDRCWRILWDWGFSSVNVEDSGLRGCYTVQRVIWDTPRSRRSVVPFSSRFGRSFKSHISFISSNHCHFLFILTFKDEAQTATFKTHFVPLSKHFISVIKANQLMVQVAVCSRINTKQINTVWAERTDVEC
jgi:hypothetical protein